MAMHEQLKFDNLDKLFKGQLPILWNAEMRRVMLDCKDRPNDTHARICKIEFRCVPKENTDGDEVNIEVQVISTVPKQVTCTHTVTLKANGTAFFHPDLVDEPDGSTLYDDDQRRLPPEK